MKNLNICKNEIENILLSYDCAIDTSYDISHVFIFSYDEDGEIESLSLNPPAFSSLSHREIDEEEMYKHSKNVKIAANEIRNALLKNDCKIDSSYDMSYVYIYDKHGNSEEI